MSTAYDRLLNRLRVDGRTVTQTREGQAQAQCPAHEDRTPSLSITRVEGQVLVHCHAGCRTPDVVAALGWTMGNLYDEPAGARYHYTDRAETVLRTVSRTPDKQFRQSGQTKGPTTLYRLPEVVAAVASNQPVYLVEGEKDVHSLESLGVVATTAPMGAGNWNKVDASPLYSAKVMVVVDDDEPGRKWALAVHDSLNGKAQSLNFYKSRVGKDAADHVAAGHGLDELDELELLVEPVPAVPQVPPTGEPATVRVATTPVDGAALLDDVEAFLARFVAFPSEAAKVATTLWAAHAHAVAVFDSSPRLALLSPEPGSGKTRTLEILDLLVPKPMHVLNASVAVTFRAVDKNQPTLLLDEVDALFGKRTKDENEELRGLLNAGHRRGAQVPRCVGPNFELKLFNVYAARALAGLGDLPDTLMSRSVVIRMRRRAPGEKVQPYRQRVHEHGGHGIGDRLAAWVGQVSEALGNAWPEMPPGVEDRPADCWEPLLAIADEAGGDWPARARDACVELVKVAASGEASLGVRLLGDLRDVFSDADALHTETILEALHKLDEAPWGDLRGKPLDARRLARFLANYEVRSVKVKVEGRSLQGYRSEHLYDAWTRYLALLPQQAEPPEPAEPSQVTGLPAGSVQPQGSGTRTEPGTSTEPGTPPLTCTVPQVPQVPDNAEAEAHKQPTLLDNARSDLGLAGLAGRCRHGVPAGDQPDDFVNGALRCTQCRADAMAS